MEFNKLYEQSLQLWPSQIDISDGKAINDGFLFAELSNYWNGAEVIAKEKGEWFDLITWIIFAALHAAAIKEFRNGLKYLKIDNLDKGDVKSRFIENLQADGYEDMLSEFKRDNPYF